MEIYNNIFFLRHLKTSNNDFGIISGQSDSEIIDTSRRLIDMSRFDKIYCSPSLRCVKTIELLGSQSYTVSSNIVYDKRLLERNMGNLEGMKKEEAKKKYSELFKEAAFNVLKTPPQGESYECFKKRITDFYNEYLCESKSDNILVCSHNQTLKLLRLVILKKYITFHSWVEYSFQNGELTIIQNEKVLDFSS